MYTVTVTDANGCTETCAHQVNAGYNANLAVVLTTTDVACYGTLSGSIVSQVSGGTTPYTYVWSTGATTADINNVGAGTYTVTVSDVNGCTASASVTINEPTQLVVVCNGTNGTCGTANGTASVVANGGT